MFKMKSAIAIFPEVFKIMFIKQECVCLPDKIISCLNFGSCGLKDKEIVIEGMIKKAIERMNNSGINRFYETYYSSLSI